MKSQSWLGRRLDGATRQQKWKAAPLTLHALPDRSGPSSLLADAVSLDWIATPVAWSDAPALTSHEISPAVSRQVKSALPTPTTTDGDIEPIGEGIDERTPVTRLESTNENWLIADRTANEPIRPAITSPMAPTSPSESSAAHQPLPNRPAPHADNAPVPANNGSTPPISLSEIADAPEPVVVPDASRPVDAGPEKPESTERDSTELPSLEITVEPSPEMELVPLPTWGDIGEQPIDSGVVEDSMVGPMVGAPIEYPDRGGEPSTLLPGSVGFGGEEPPTTSQNRDGTTDESTAGPRTAKSSKSSASSSAEGSFRLGRGDSGTGEVTVVFRLQGLSGNAIETTERSTTIPPGAQSVRVSPGVNAQGQPYEVAVLTVLSINGVAVSRPSVTLFQQGKPASCSEQALYDAFRQAGSQEAFAALVQRHRPGVFRTSYQVLGNWADAEDVSQIVFLAFAQQQLKFNTTLQGWLQKAARNAAIALLRAKARRARHEREAALPEIGRTGDNQHELREVLLAAMKEIAPPVREAVRLRYMEGRSQHEAAEIVGVPRGTLSQRASQGVREPRDVLEQKGAFAG